MHAHAEINCLCLKTKLHKYTHKYSSNQAVYNQHLKPVLFSFSYTLAHTYIFSPFSLFSEVARPLSKVCFAKGRVHFHIFPFDMRRLSIQGYVFLSCFLPHPILLFSLCSSRCSAHSLIPVLCSTHCSLACLGGPGKTWHKQLLSNYQGEKQLLLYTCVCEYVFMHDCRKMHVRWMSMWVWGCK